MVRGPGHERRGEQGSMRTSDRAQGSMGKVTERRDDARVCSVGIYYYYYYYCVSDPESPRSGIVTLVSTYRVEKFDSWLMAELQEYQEVLDFQEKSSGGSSACRVLAEWLSP
eukprot:8951694-Pyramimonas_sp.AAC.1